MIRNVVMVRLKPTCDAARLAEIELAPMAEQIARVQFEVPS
jgi:hypothetical protein